jgi:hypothetical protein
MECSGFRIGNTPEDAHLGLKHVVKNVRVLRRKEQFVTWLTDYVAE